MLMRFKMTASSTVARILYRQVIQGSSVNPSVCAGGGCSPSEREPSLTQLDGPVESQDCASGVTEISGVIFDMDGTLTLPVLNFSEMRARLNLTPSQDILPTVQKYPPKERARAMAIIEECEDEALAKLKLQPGVLDLLHFIAERGLPVALITRNSTKAAHVFLDRLHQELTDSQGKYPHLKNEEVFSEVLTRDFEPCKPDPASVLHICRQWSLQPSGVALIGDDKTDMKCGLRAGTGVNVLLRNERNRTQVNYSNFAVDTLSEIITLFSSTMDVVPKKEE